MLLGRCLLCSPGTSFWERGVDGEHRGAPGPPLGKAPRMPGHGTGGLDGGVLQLQHGDAKPGRKSCVWVRARAGARWEESSFQLKRGYMDI